MADTFLVLLCSAALMVVMWQRAPLRALSTSGACSRGKWRRSFPSSMGKGNPVSPPEVVCRCCDFIPGVLPLWAWTESTPGGRCVLAGSAVSEVSGEGWGRLCSRASCSVLLNDMTGYPS